MTHISPSDLDLVPPLLRSLTTLLRLRGRAVSSRVLEAGLGGSTSAGACLRAAAREGLQGRIAVRPKLADISPLTLPCILLLGGHRSCVLLAFTEEEATVIFPENGETLSVVPIAALEKEYAADTPGFICYSKVEAVAWQ